MMFAVLLSGTACRQSQGPIALDTDAAIRLRNQEYHRPGDSYDRLDYNRMAKVVDGVMAALLR